MAEARQTCTENGAVTFSSSGNPLVDFFFQANPSPQTWLSPILVVARRSGFQLHALQRVSLTESHSSVETAN